MNGDRLSDTAPSPDTDVIYVVYVILPHPTAPRLLLLPEGEGWSLPRLLTSSSAMYVAYVRQELQDRWGVEATVLRWALLEADPTDPARQVVVLVLENHSPAWAAPSGALWVGPEDLADLALAIPAHRAVLATYLHEEATGDIPAQRAPWASPGWLAVATDWIARQLAELAITPQGRVEQMRLWSISCILRVPTDAGDLYFKAVPPLFATEPRITEALAARYPDYMPQVLASAQDHGWMLLRDFGVGQALEELPLPDWEAAVRLCGQIQRSYVDQIDALLALGCQDFRLDVLAAQVDGLLADLPGLPGLTAAERVQLAACAPRLPILCAQLAAYALPATLTHGDFHAGNILRNGERTIIYDWTDASVAHPFLDMATIVEWMPREAPPDARARLWTAYLTAWADYDTPERLGEAAQLGEVLGCLRQVLSYRQLTASLEPVCQPEMAEGIPMWIRRMLNLMTTYGFDQSPDPRPQP